LHWLRRAFIDIAQSKRRFYVQFLLKK
jgi:hypothetical protein